MSFTETLSHHRRQIEYLLWITQPFFKFMTALSKTKDVTVHRVFGIYNRLFDHLDKSIHQLRPKKIPWKKLMLTALEAARSKLSHYYAQTDHIPGDLYAIGTIIAPENKLHYFTRKEWKDPKKNWCKIYRESLERLFKPYKQRLTNQLPSNIPSSASQDDELGLLLNSSQSQESFSSQNDELAWYLGSSKYSHHNRKFFINTIAGPLPTAPRVLSQSMSAR